MEFPRGRKNFSVDENCSAGVNRLLWKYLIFVGISKAQLAPVIEKLNISDLSGRFSSEKMLQGQLSLNDYVVLNV